MTLESTSIPEYAAIFYDKSRRLFNDSRHVSTKMCTAGRKRRGKRIRRKNQVNGHQLRSSGALCEISRKQTGWSRASQSSPRSRWKRHTKGNKKEREREKTMIIIIPYVADFFFFLYSIPLKQFDQPALFSSSISQLSIDRCVAKIIMRK